MCNDDYWSVTEMMNCVGAKRRNSFREHYLNPALQEGAVEAKYPDSPFHPQQRYKLTEAAIKWKESNGGVGKQ